MESLFINKQIFYKCICSTSYFWSKNVKFFLKWEKNFLPLNKEKYFNFLNKNILKYLFLWNIFVL